MMCFDRYREVHLLVDPSGARKLGHKSRDNLSNTYTARNPNRVDSVLLASSVGSAPSFWVRFLPTMGARMRMPFSPRLTKRPSEVPGAKRIDLQHSSLQDTSLPPPALAIIWRVV